MTATILVLTGATFACLRIAGETSTLFQALVHLYVGGLFGAWYASRKPWLLEGASTLSLLELFAFLVSRHG